MIVGVDFDGTIVKHRYPDIGDEMPGAIETLKALARNGHTLFLWTMRGHPRKLTERDTLQEAIEWLESRGLNFGYCVNRSPAQFSTSKKQYANIYLDDSAWGAPLYRDPRTGDVLYDWLGLAEDLEKAGIIKEKDLEKIRSEF